MSKSAASLGGTDISNPIHTHPLATDLLYGLRHVALLTATG